MSTVRMQYTDTTQPQWSNWESRSLGDEGDYTLQIIWTRLGAPRERTYSFESSAACCRDMHGLLMVVL